MTNVVIVVSLVLVAAVVLWFVLVRRHPENAAGHAEPARAGAAQFFGDVNDRPGSPGAEDDGVAAPGQPAPGPSAESPASPQSDAPQ